MMRRVNLKSINFLFYTILFCACTHYKGYSQAIDVSKLNAEERKAVQAKIEAESRIDWKNMLDLLNLKTPELVPLEEDPKKPKDLTQKVPGSIYYFDKAGNQVVRTRWGNWTNYDESEANNYTINSPLQMKNGKVIKTAKEWWNNKRPEILKLYQDEIYGHIPVNTPEVKFSIVSIDSNAANGKAIKKIIIGSIDNSRYPQAKPSVPITLYQPKNSKGKIPLIVVVNGFLEGFPGSKASTATILDLVLEKGWAVASVNTGAIQADNGAGFKTGIIGLMNKGQNRKPSDWGVFSAWSWGLSKAMDYFITDPNIDSKKIGIAGHSRWGKTALLASALDTRWAACYSSCAGSMGSALEKRHYGENIDHVADAGEYHWMAGNFLKYAGNWQNMPVDAHELIALVAPRPLLITGGTQDLWADPKGEFLASQAATPVYELLGKAGIKSKEMPAPDVALTDGELAFREHNGGHSDMPDWPIFLEFAGRYFK